MHCLKTHILINELIVTNLRYQESNAEILAKALELLEFIENHNSADNDSSFWTFLYNSFRFFQLSFYPRN